MNPQELYMAVVGPALASFATRNVDMTSAKQLADALATECVSECMRLGIIPSSGQPSRRNGNTSHGVPGQANAPSGPLGLPQFAQHEQQGSGPAQMIPFGAPQEQLRHYNHIPGEQQTAPEPPKGQVFIGGQQFVAPAGVGAYSPPAQIQAGVMSTVTQAPNPQGQSALGTMGVISQPEQKPNTKETVVNPQGQAMVPIGGAGGSTFVPERIVR